jgi:hypothetical protein
LPLEVEEDGAVVIEILPLVDESLASWPDLPLIISISPASPYSGLPLDISIFPT